MTEKDYSKREIDTKLETIVEMIGVMSEKLDAQDKAIKPLLEVLEGTKLGTRFLAKAFALIMALGALYLMVVSVLKK